MKSSLDPQFAYTKAIDTDLKKTFARVRKEIKEREKQLAAAENVRPITPIREKKS